MLRLLFLLFITIPLLELWLLIEVGSGIGGLSTIALCLLTAALGGFLIRYQGLSTLVDAQKRMAQGEAFVVRPQGLYIARKILEMDGALRPMAGHPAHFFHQGRRAAAVDMGLARFLEDFPEIEGPVRVAAIRDDFL